MRPLDFYELALQLAQTAATEAECRTVISRIYTMDFTMNRAVGISGKIQARLPWGEEAGIYA